MPGKWGGAHLVRPPRSANELGCQANWGGAHRAHPPLDPPMDTNGSTRQWIELRYHFKTFYKHKDYFQSLCVIWCFQCANPLFSVQKNNSDSCGGLSLSKQNKNRTEKGASSNQGSTRRLTPIHLNHML